jgi:hypothetical protein
MSLLTAELFILGLLLRTFLRSLFGLESASLSGAFFPILAFALTLGSPFSPGLFLPFTTTPLVFCLLLRTFLRSLFGHSLSLLLTMAAFVFRRSLCSRIWFRL